MKPHRSTDTLLEYALAEMPRLATFASKRKEKAAGKAATRFLQATMDEARVRGASELSEAVLECTDAADAEHFRRALLRREATNDVSYSRQRDHSAHTVNNWLLGWFIRDASRVLDEALTQAMSDRELLAKDFDADYCFSSLWPYVSILHDVGYIFEGSLDALDRSYVTASAQRGFAVVAEYFKWQRWTDFGVRTRAERLEILALADVPEMELGSSESLAAIASGLRDLGELGSLAGDSGAAGVVPDAFAVWRRQYKEANVPIMVERINELEDAFIHQYARGSSHDLRILDHGVCSGLLLLKYATSFYQIMAGLHRNPIGAKASRAARAFLKRAGRGYEDSGFWSNGIAWATAATALHNLQQSPLDWGEGHRPLALADDPLAYLGILVDTLQEWDRYSASRTRLVDGGIPVQGGDVRIGRSRDRAIILYESADLASKVAKDLTRCLEGWRDVVDVLGGRKP